MTAWAGVLFSLFFFSLSDNRKFKSFVILLSILFYSLALINFFFLGKSKKFDSLPATLEAVLIIIYCIYYFYAQLNKPQVSFIYSTFHFWITIGIFLYLAGWLIFPVRYFPPPFSRRYHPEIA